MRPPSIFIEVIGSVIGATVSWPRSEAPAFLASEVEADDLSSLRAGLDLPCTKTPSASHLPWSIQSYWTTSDRIGLSVTMWPTLLHPTTRLWDEDADGLRFWGSCQDALLDFCCTFLHQGHTEIE